MSVTLTKAPAVSAAASTGYVVCIPGAGAFPVNVQSVQESTHTPGYVHVHVEDSGLFWSALLPAGLALTLATDQGETAAYLR